MALYAPEHGFALGSVDMYLIPDKLVEDMQLNNLLNK